MVALFAAALSQEFDITIVCGRDMFSLPTFLQPINRNIFGIAEEFGLGELFMLATPRKISLSTERFSTIPFLKAGGRGAPVPGLQKEYPDTPEGKTSRENDLRETYASYIRSRPVDSEISRWKEVLPTLIQKDPARFESGPYEVLEAIKAKIENPFVDKGTVTVPTAPTSHTNKIA